MKNYKGVYFTKCSLVILLFIFNACDIQKRRYNKGFYMNNGAHPKTFVNHKTDLLLKSKGSINTTNFSEELSMSTDTESVEIIDSVLVAHDKINYIKKKAIKFYSRYYYKKAGKKRYPKKQ